MATLITEWEVIKETPVKDEFPTANITQVKELMEEQAFCDWIGEDFYDILLADLADHSTAVAWDRTATYASVAKVIYEGCVFISQSDGNTDSPVNSSNWQEASKFTTGEYNLLWPKLKKYLALVIIQPAITSTTFATDSGGTREVFDEGSGRKTASPRVFQVSNMNLQKLEAAAKNSLRRFIEKANKDDDRKPYYEKVDFLTCYRPMAQQRTSNRWAAYKKRT